MAASIKIDPLVGDNYDTWKIHMRAILKKNDLWEYVTGEKPKPEPNAPGAQEWYKMDGKAESDILLAISPGELKALNGLETSKAIWDKLRSMYESRGPARKASLLKRLVLTRMQECDDLKNHISDFFDTVKKLREIGLEIVDELLAILLLYSFPESFEMFRTSMESRDELPSTDVLKVKILERHEGNKPADSSVQGALYTKRSHTRQQPRQARPERDYVVNKKKTECFRCGRVGHIAKDCRAKCPSKPKQSVKQVENKVSISKNSPGGSTLLSTTEESLHTDTSVDGWCIDSGCTGHMCNEREMFENFTRMDNVVSLANSGSSRIAGTGSVKIVADTGNSDHEITFEKVFFVPDLRTNLLPVAKATDHGCEVLFRRNEAIVTNKNNQVILRADRKDNLYYVKKGKNCANIVEQDFTPKRGIDIWHAKMGHLNERDLKLMAKSGAVYGLDFKSNEKLSACEVCIREKQTRLPFTKSTDERTQQLLEIVHTDVCGPMRHPSCSGLRYFVTFIDDKSRWCEVFFLKKKSDVLDAFKQYKEEAENATGRKIQALQSDNGTEYINKDFENFVQSHGIKRRLATPHSPQQNGIAERKNRTLVEMARCMMRQAGAPPVFWAEAIYNANFTRNRCPTRALNGQIPYKLCTGKVPTVRYMQIFGTKAYVLNKNQTKSKFDSRSEQGIFLGYSQISKGYRIYMPKTRKTVTSRDVKFMNVSGFNREYEEILDDDDGSDKITIDLGDLNTQNNAINEEEAQNGEGKRSSTPEERSTTISWDALIQAPKRGRGRPRLLRSGTVGRPRKQYGPADRTSEESSQSPEDVNMIIESANMSITEDPTSWEQASKTQDANAWKIALEDEYIAQIKNCTWEIAERPPNRKVIGSRFVFCTKSNGTVEKRKARLVAKGCSQRPGEDFSETHSPVVRSTSIRILAALAAERNLEIHQMDVVTAYLNGELNESVYMEVPEQLREVLQKIVSGKPMGSSMQVISNTKMIETARRWLRNLKNCKSSVCLLKKSLYGLRQAGLQWHRKLVQKLQELGFNAMPQDPCMFIREKDNSIGIIAIYVDDILIASDNNVWVSEIKKSLSDSFETKDFGKVSRCLGIEFSRDEHFRVFLKQQSYIESLLKRFNMEECKPAQTPMEANCKLSKPESVNEDEMQKYPYQRLIGALLYLATSTRPDISYSVNYLSQFNSNYNFEHWKAAKRILRYLKGTADCGLTYERTNLPMFGVVDADWASDIVDRRSYSGFAFILAGSVISWEARKQRTVAQSSTEAEYMALAEATKEALYLRSVLCDVGILDDDQTITLFSDNQGAIKLAQNNSFHARTKHIDVRHHFIRDAQDRGTINLEYLPTDKMPADVLTKGLSAVKHRECLSNIGMSNVHK